MKKIASIASLMISIFSLAQKPVLVVPKGHSDNADKVAISGDDKYVATGGWDKSVHIWQLATGNEIKVLDGYPAWVNAVAFSPNGKLLASGSRKELRINDMTAGAKEIFKQSVHSDNITALAFSADSKMLVSGAQTDKKNYSDDVYELKIWKTTGMVMQKRIEISGNLWSLRFDEKGDLLAILFGKIIHIDVATGAVKFTEKFGEDGGSYLSPDGHWFIATGFEKGGDAFNLDSLNLDALNSFSDHATVTVIDRHTKLVAHVFKGQKASIKDVGFSPDSRYITTGADNTIFIYDLEEMKKVGELTNTMSYPAGFAFTSDGKTFLAGNYDGIVRVYDFAQQAVKRELGGHANIIYNMDLSVDGKSLVVLGNQGYYRDGYIQLLDMDRGAVGKNNHASAMNFTGAFSPDKKYIVSGSFEDALTVMDAASLQKLSNVAEDNIASSVAFSSDGKKMITTDRNNDDYQMELRSLPSGEVLKKIKLPYTAGSLLFAPDGHTVYAGISKDDKTVKIDLQTGKIVQTFQHPGEYAGVTGIRKLLLTEDGNTLITGDDYGHIRWWNVSTGKETGDLYANKGRVNGMILLPNGKQLATCGGESAFTDADIKIIDIATKQVVKTLKGHENSPTALAATADGKYLLSGSYDRTVKVWNLATGEALATMVFFGGTDWVMVDKSGRFDGTPDGMRQMYYTRSLDVLPLESSFEQFYTPALLPRLLQGENFTPPSVDINTIKTAPTVKITYKGETRNLEVADDEPVYSSASPKVLLEVNAVSSDDVISEMRLYQNGKLITGGTRNLVVEDAGKATDTKSYEVELTEGENIIKAVALNSQRTESRPAIITVNFKPEKKESNATASSTLHLLVVGVNTYKNPKYTLNYATADATAFKESMENGSKDIFAKADVTFLSDAEASKDKIVAALEKIKQTAAPQDMFVFYYAGHGVINDAKEFFLVPYDVLQLYGNDDALAQKGISAEQLQQCSKEIKAQKQLFILDACQSAGALNEVAASRGAAEEKAIAQLARSTGTHWLTASGSEQFASEFAQLGHGSFTYCILEALKGAADNGDSKITVKELDAYLQDKVPEITQKFKGTAQYPASYNYGNDFPIIILH